MCTHWSTRDHLWLFSGSSLDRFLELSIINSRGALMRGRSRFTNREQWVCPARRDCIFDIEHVCMCRTAYRSKRQALHADFFPFGTKQGSITLNFRLYKLLLTEWHKYQGYREISEFPSDPFQHSFSLLCLGKVWFTGSSHLKTSMSDIFLQLWLRKHMPIGTHYSVFFAHKQTLHFVKLSLSFPLGKYVYFL